MEFFDRKEEVIEIKLTQFGKRKLADGRFSPKFYAFYDDDIIYDNSYCGVTEQAAAANQRIKDSIRMKSQTSKYGIETDISKKIEAIRLTNGNVKPTNIQQVEEKSYTLMNPIGKSNKNTNYAPSWEIQGYYNKISNIETSVQSGSYHTIKIPQIELEDVEYSIVSLPTPDTTSRIFGHTFPDDTTLSIDTKTGEVLFSIRENNSPLANEKFDLEFYMVDEEDGEENLVQLNFKKDTVTMINDILIDDPIEYEEHIDETYAEKYFMVQVDDEIPPEVILSGSGHGTRFVEISEARGFGNSNSLRMQENQNAEGVVGSQTLASLTPDQIASLTDDQLNNLGTLSEEDRGVRNPYDQIPANPAQESCGTEEQ